MRHYLYVTMKHNSLGSVKLLVVEKNYLVSLLWKKIVLLWPSRIYNTHFVGNHQLNIITSVV